MLDQLIKIANILDSLGDPVATQVSEGIDVAVSNAFDKMAQFDDSVPEKALALANSINARVEDLQRKYLALEMLCNKLPAVLRTNLHNNAKAALEALQRAKVDQTFVNKLVEEHFESGYFEPPEPESGLHTRVLGPDETEKENVSSEYGGLDLDIHSTPKWEVSSASIMEDLVKIADIFDGEGLHAAAALMDRIIVEAYPNAAEPTKVPRADLYDSDARNKELVGDLVRKEVEENRKLHHVETFREIPGSHTRYSPELPGVMMARISDNVYQDILTGKKYDFKNGWTDENGTRHPGGSVANQTPLASQIAAPAEMFQSRIELNKRRK